MRHLWYKMHGETVKFTLAGWCICSTLARDHKFFRLTSSFATIHEQQIPLPHYCKIGDLARESSVSQNQLLHPALFTSVLHKMACLPVRQQWWTSARPLRILCTLFWHPAPPLHHNTHLPIVGQFLFLSPSLTHTHTHTNRHHNTSYCMGSTFQRHCHCASTYPTNRTWPTVVPSVAYWIHYKSSLYQKLNQPLTSTLQCGELCHSQSLPTKGPFCTSYILCS